jgi:hypothetical protein
MLLNVGLHHRTPSQRSQSALSSGSHDNDGNINDIDPLGAEPAFIEESSVASEANQRTTKRSQTLPHQVTLVNAVSLVI